MGISPVIQWLRLCAPNAGADFDSCSGNQSRNHTPQLKNSACSTKTWNSQINKYFVNVKMQIMRLSSSACTNLFHYHPINLFVHSPWIPMAHAPFGSFLGLTNSYHS